jgi:putative SbcD/Mre11-related phosphoesterase
MIRLLTPHPAALAETQKTRILVIADLHIGWELALSKKGIHVPTQTQKLQQRLSTLISEYRPQELLILGDVKHTVATAEMGEWHDVPDFFNSLKSQVSKISVIRGNHDGNLDPLLPENVKTLPATGASFGDIGFFHGHRWPSPTILSCKTLVMGHVHPVISFRDPAGFRISRQVWVRADCDRTRMTEVLLQRYRVKVENSAEKALMKHYGIRSRVQQLFIMPSFNDFLGGRPLNVVRGNAKTEITLGPVLRSGAVNVEEADTYLLDGTFLGTLSQLKAIA